jgi:hypothetical protein
VDNRCSSEIGSKMGGEREAILPPSSEFLQNDDSFIKLREKANNSAASLYKT